MPDTEWIKAEVLTKKYLLDRGADILSENYSVHGVGEIDLIALTDKKVLAFIEVKERAIGEYGHPLEAINKAKKKKIIATAASFLSQTTVRYSAVRFDAAYVYHDEFQYLEDVFWARWD